MTVSYTLPEINVRNAGGKNRKRKRIPSMSRHGPRVYSDVVVGGALALLRTKTMREVAEIVGCELNTVRAWHRGSNRPHAIPRDPDAIFWAEVEKHKACAQK